MREHLLQLIDSALQSVSELKKEEVLDFMESSSRLIAHTFKMGGKILIAGNGGSLCDAMHFAEELTGFFQEIRPALPAIALSDPGHITCTANDVGFDQVFARGVEAYGQLGDVFIGLTTSGNSINIIRAFEAAKLKGMKTIAFLGRDGGALKGIADLEMVIFGNGRSDRIQEAHMTAIHMIIQKIEEILFSKTASWNFASATLPSNS